MALRQDVSTKIVVDKQSAEFLTRSTLKKTRGWTEKLIRNFLGAPDKTKTNYRFRTPIQLFDVLRVQLVESTQEFKAAKEATDRRKDSAKKAIETKLNKLHQWVSEIVIKIPNIEKDKLISASCDSYNNFRKDRFEDWVDAHKNSDPTFISRICVNYIRHELTDYEEKLCEMSGKVGFSNGYIELRRKIFTEIGRVYPWLIEECDRQQNKHDKLEKHHKVSIEDIANTIGAY